MCGSDFFFGALLAVRCGHFGGEVHPVPAGVPPYAHRTAVWRHPDRAGAWRIPCSFYRDAWA